MGEKVAVRHGRVPEQYVGIGQALLEPAERDFSYVGQQTSIASRTECVQGPDILGFVMP
jgi:hypothetical protein